MSFAARSSQSMLRSALRARVRFFSLAPRVPADRLRQPTALLTARAPFAAPARRWLSDDSRAKIQEAVGGTPVVLFMKGDPQCGFSRAAVQILEMQGVPMDKLRTFDVLQDSELRNDIKEFS
jgi:monothiol glutaredoxin